MNSASESRPVARFGASAILATGLRPISSNPWGQREILDLGLVAVDRHTDGERLDEAPGADMDLTCLGIGRRSLVR
jgi:hypothetical protein